MRQHGILVLVLLFPLLGGCSDSTISQGTTTIPLINEETTNVTIAPPSFDITGFTTIAGDSGTRLAAYGQDMELGRPMLAIYDIQAHVWAERRLSETPGAVNNAYMAVGDGEDFGGAVNIQDTGSQRLSTAWITLENKEWRLETPLIWTGTGAVGVAFIGHEWYVATPRGTSIQLWRLAGSDWVADTPPPSGGFAISMSSNSTHLQFCFVDQTQNIVYASRAPGAATYAMEVVRARPPGVIAGGRCVIGSQPVGYPVLSWFSPVAVGDRDARTYGAFKDGDLWNVTVLSTNLAVPYPEQVVATPTNGTFVHTMNSSEFFMLRDEKWTACPLPDHDFSATGVVRWGDSAMQAVYQSYPKPVLTLEPLGSSCQR